MSVLHQPINPSSPTNPPLRVYLFLCSSFDPSATWSAFICADVPVLVTQYPWPMINTLKSVIVPESTRSTVYSLYRVPLNLFVLVTLLMTSSIRASFCITSGLLMVACAAQFRLLLLSRKEHVGSTYLPVGVAEYDFGELVVTDSSSFSNAKRSKIRRCPKRANQSEVEVSYVIGQVDTSADDSDDDDKLMC